MRSTILEIRGVTDMGQKSESSLGLDTLGTGVITAFFQRLGGLPCIRLRLTMCVMMGVSSVAQCLKSQYGVLSTIHALTQHKLCYS